MLRVSGCGLREVSAKMRVRNEDGRVLLNFSSEIEM